MMIPALLRAVTVLDSSFDRLSPDRLKVDVCQEEPGRASQENGRS